MRVSNQFNVFQSRQQKSRHHSIHPPGQQRTKPLIQPINKFITAEPSSQKFDLQEQVPAGSLQNGQITQFYFQKLIHIEYQLCLVVFLNLFLVIVASSISFPELRPQDTITHKGCLYFCLVCFIIQCFLLWFRMVTVLELQKQQKILYQKSTIFSSKKIFYYMAECIIMFIQPYPFFQSLALITHNSYDQEQFSLPINDLLTVISILRIYVLIRAGLILTPYQNTRSNRLCKMYGCKADYSFSLKCMFKDNPLILIGIFFTISAMIFAFQIYLIQRRAAVLSQSARGISNNYFNALWLVLMTITTVGYGDYFPHTSIGRIIILIVAIWGTFIVSMMVVVVSNTLTMEKNQKRTSIIINKLQMRKDIEKQAQKLVGYFMLKKRHQKITKTLETQLKNSQDLTDQKQLEKKKEENYIKMKNYSYLCNRAQKGFSRLRKQIKTSQDIQDIEDQVSSHFLHVNSDIQILNKNQQKIISFIHEYLEYNGKNKEAKQTNSDAEDFDEDDDIDKEVRQTFDNPNQKENSEQ